MSSGAPLNLVFCVGTSTSKSPRNTDQLTMQRVAAAALGRAVCLGARRVGSAAQARSLQLHNAWQAPVAARQFHFSRPVAGAAGEVRECKEDSGESGVFDSAL